MSPVVISVLGVALRVPRASGDEPGTYTTGALSGECSPRERG